MAGGVPPTSRDRRSSTAMPLEEVRRRPRWPVLPRVARPPGPPALSNDALLVAASCSRSTPSSSASPTSRARWRSPSPTGALRWRAGGAPTSRGGPASSSSPTTTPSGWPARPPARAWRCSPPSCNGPKGSSSIPTHQGELVWQRRRSPCGRCSCWPARRDRRARERLVFPEGAP